MNSTNSGQVWFLSGDLMFASRVSAAAQQAGLAFKLSGQLPAQQADPQDTPGWFILDLATRGSLLPGVYHEAVQRFPAARWIAYGPHVQTERLQAAKDAGIPTVLTRGQFNAQLPNLFSTG